jgi:hypothetical protein
MLKNVPTASEILPRKDGFESVINAPEVLC